MDKSKRNQSSTVKSKGPEYNSEKSIEVNLKHAELTDTRKNILKDIPSKAAMSVDYVDDSELSNAKKGSTGARERKHVRVKNLEENEKQANIGKGTINIHKQKLPDDFIVDNAQPGKYISNLTFQENQWDEMENQKHFVKNVGKRETTTHNSNLASKSVSTLSTPKSVTGHEISKNNDVDRSHTDSSDGGNPVKNRCIIKEYNPIHHPPEHYAYAEEKSIITRLYQKSIKCYEQPEAYQRNNFDDSRATRLFVLNSSSEKNETLSDQALLPEAFSNALKCSFTSEIINVADENTNKTETALKRKKKERRRKRRYWNGMMSEHDQSELTKDTGKSEEPFRNQMKGSTDKSKETENSIGKSNGQLVNEKNEQNQISDKRKDHLNSTDKLKFIEKSGDVQNSKQVALPTVESKTMHSSGKIKEKYCSTKGSSQESKPNEKLNSEILYVKEDAEKNSSRNKSKDAQERSAEKSKETQNSVEKSNDQLVNKKTKQDQTSHSKHEEHQNCTNKLQSNEITRDVHKVDEILKQTVPLSGKSKSTSTSKDNPERYEHFIKRFEEGSDRNGKSKRNSHIKETFRKSCQSCDTSKKNSYKSEETKNYINKSRNKRYRNECNLKQTVNVKSPLIASNEKKPQFDNPQIYPAVPKDPENISFQAYGIETDLSQEEKKFIKEELTEDYNLQETKVTTNINNREATQRGNTKFDADWYENDDGSYDFKEWKTVNYSQNQKDNRKKDNEKENIQKVTKGNVKRYLQAHPLKEKHIEQIEKSKQTSMSRNLIQQNTKYKKQILSNFNKNVQEEKHLCTLITCKGITKLSASAKDNSPMLKSKECVDANYAKNLYSRDNKSNIKQRDNTQKDAKTIQNSLRSLDIDDKQRKKLSNRVKRSISMRQESTKQVPKQNKEHQVLVVEKDIEKSTEKYRCTKHSTKSPEKDRRERHFLSGGILSQSPEQTEGIKHSSNEGNPELSIHTEKNAIKAEKYPDGEILTQEKCTQNRNLISDMKAITNNENDPRRNVKEVQFIEKDVSTKSHKQGISSVLYKVEVTTISRESHVSATVHEQDGSVASQLQNMNVKAPARDVYTLPQQQNAFTTKAYSQSVNTGLYQPNVKKVQFIEKDVSTESHKQDNSSVLYKEEVTTISPESHVSATVHEQDGSVASQLQNMNVKAPARDVYTLPQQQNVFTTEVYSQSVNTGLYQPIVIMVPYYQNIGNVTPHQQVPINVVEQSPIGVSEYMQQPISLVQCTLGIVNMIQYQPVPADLIQGEEEIFCSDCYQQDAANFVHYTPDVDRDCYQGNITNAGHYQDLVTSSLEYTPGLAEQQDFSK